MFRVAPVLAVVLAVGVAFADGGAAVSPAVATKAHLRVGAVQPLLVLGGGFRAGETVRITASTDDGFGAKTATAGAAGRIGVRFRQLSLGRCPTYVISAKGNKGSRATVRSVPYPCGIDP
jgi:hypothetical protein